VACRFEGDKLRLEFASSLSDFFKKSATAKDRNLVLEGRLGQ